MNTTVTVSQDAPRFPQKYDSFSMPSSPSLQTVVTLHGASEPTTPSLLPLPPPKYSEPLPHIYSGSIDSVFENELRGIDIDECEGEGENAFFVCDLVRVWNQWQRWQKELGGRVDPFFAVKANPDPCVLHLLATLGLGFDCASQSEISSVLSLGVPPSRIIYANPCKASSFIRKSAKQGVQMMTFDNEEEIVKVQKFNPNAKLVLRILTDDSASLCKLGLKFGAKLTDVRRLLKKAKETGMNVIGIAFHVGSGNKDPLAYEDALHRAKVAFDIGKEEGFDFDFLDIGGGFENDIFEDAARCIRNSLDKFFPGDKVRVIAEPGRYFVADAFELATNVIAKRGKDGVEESSGFSPPESDEESPSSMYYINDGVYGAFNCTMFDHQIVFPKILTLNGIFQPQGDQAALYTDTEKCSVWGPTCDSIDLVAKDAPLPTDLQVGDWLKWENMGAYTICAASQFNGFKKSEVRYTLDTKGDEKLEVFLRSLLNGAV
ncbi:hypothetical protein BT69DRAFT_1336932 [Atractiella rhizophila]|nr:hypothetical protein BT69DRAFT_1336932 [Atractiella rhizophila]